MASKKESPISSRTGDLQSNRNTRPKPPRGKADCMDPRPLLVATRRKWRIDNMIRGNRMAFLLLVMFSSMLLVGCTSDVPVEHCNNWDFDCSTKRALENMNVVKENIEFWSLINIAGGVSAVAFGVIATLMIALQGDENRHWTRPIGIIATTLVTGISSALVNFHVPDNIDKLIDIAGKMADNTIEFEKRADNLRAERDKKTVESDYRTDQSFRESVNALVQEFANKQNKLKLEMMKIKGTAARLEKPKPGTPINKP